jgi:hypothetical protein
VIGAISDPSTTTSQLLAGALTLALLDDKKCPFERSKTSILVPGGLPPLHSFWIVHFEDAVTRTAGSGRCLPFDVGSDEQPHASTPAIQTLLMTNIVAREEAGFFLCAASSRVDLMIHAITSKEYVARRNVSWNLVGRRDGRR